MLSRQYASDICGRSKLYIIYEMPCFGEKVASHASFTDKSFPECIIKSLEKIYILC